MVRGGYTKRVGESYRLHIRKEVTGYDACSNHLIAIYCKTLKENISPFHAKKLQKIIGLWSKIFSKAFLTFFKETISSIPSCWFHHPISEKYASNWIKFPQCFGVTINFIFNHHLDSLFCLHGFLAPTKPCSAWRLSRPAIDQSLLRNELLDQQSHH